MKFNRLLRDFLQSEKSGGMVLIAVSLISILISNSPLESDYLSFWNMEVANHSLIHWVNDGLMAIFFLLIGLELERELYIGELSNLKKASLPVIAALGGMIVPVILYAVFNAGSSYMSGSGIPMATDIAFALAILSLAGNKIPASMKIFLLALAIIDDLGAILVIAIFYGGAFSLNWFIAAVLVLGILLTLNRLKVYKILPYILLGIVLWYCVLKSGIHASISGVLLAFAIPFQKGEQNSISYKIQSFLHQPVAFFILPIFALANTAIVLDSSTITRLSESYSLGIISGLWLGKPLGVLLFCFLAVKFKLSTLPGGLGWKHILGIGLLAGIGFTMSIFITMIAFNDPVVIATAKFSIIIASVLSAVAGYFYLKVIFRQN